VISRTDYLAELNRLSESQKHNDDGLTVTEMSEESRMHDQTMRKLLHAAKKAGRLWVGKKSVECLNGRFKTVDCYRILPEKADE